MDSVLLRLAVIAAVALVLAQMALRSSLFLALYSPVDRLEGIGRPNSAQLAAWERFLAERTVSSQTTTMSISLELLQPQATPKIKVLVNGEIRGSFIRPTLTVRVNRGDLVEIDSQEESGEITVRVKETSPNLYRPMVGQYLQAAQEIRPLGRVESKSIR